uniref:Uncharacterized protein n=1 Tax=Zea mays TaxID=4577 RepID=C4J3N2_MAIZE|nr:unknown [Zea mays]
MWARNTAQRARPTVCAPDSAVRSRASRPLAPNADSSAGSDASGGGRLAFAAPALASRASRRPSGTAHRGPPSRLTASRAARARMSAQETVALQDASTWALMASMTSYPRSELALGPAFFSPVKLPGTSSSKTEASQPLTKQSWKKRRRRDAPMRGSARTARATPRRTMGCSPGHVAS